MYGEREREKTEGWREREREEREGGERERKEEGKKEGDNLLGLVLCSYSVGPGYQVLNSGHQCC